MGVVGVVVGVMEAVRVSQLSLPPPSPHSVNN